MTPLVLWLAARFPLERPHLARALAVHTAGGAAVVTVALVMLSMLDNSSPYWFAGIAMYVMGLGLGLTMQVLIVVVQNSVDRSDIGVATSSVTFFRQMGGAFGTALFGAILSSRLATHMADVLAGTVKATSVAIAPMSATWL